MFDNELEARGRRRFVKVAAGSLVAAGAIAGGGVFAFRAKEAQEAKLATLPWPKATLAPEKVMASALERAQAGGCGEAVFDALVGTAAATLGSPYDQFPTAMFRFASGGVQGLGTTCGALTAAAAAFELLSPAPGPVTESLFAWYRNELLPDRALANAKFPLVPSVAGSPLCGESIARWSQAAGQPGDCDARRERCGLLAACVARRAAELLQLQANGKPLAGATTAEPRRGCESPGPATI